MGNEVVEVANAMEAFQQRVIEKLRADFGKMLPDEVVNGLVKRAIDEQFFEPRTIKDGSYNTREEPSWFIQEITKLGEPILRKMLKTYLETHKPEIEKAMTEFIGTQNLTLITIAAMRDMTRQDLSDLAQSIIVGLRQP